MASIVSKVSLCNLALSRVGEQEITSLDGLEKNAQICNLLYDEVLEQVLSQHHWNCATFRKVLAQSATAPVFGWTYSYPLPTDPRCLKVLYTEEEEAFSVEGRNLVTDSETATINYIGFVDNPMNLDSMCRKVFYLSMAVEMAYRMTENNTILNGLYEQLGEAWKDARIRDAQEGTPMYVDNHSWIRARTNGIGYGRSLTTRR